MEKSAHDAQLQYTLDIYSYISYRGPNSAEKFEQIKFVFLTKHETKIIKKSNITIIIIEIFLDGHLSDE